MATKNKQATDVYKATRQELIEIVEELQNRLSESEETILAIQKGEVDAIVSDTVDGGRQVFTLSGAELVYRRMVETMAEGAAILLPDLTISYCNAQLARMLGHPAQQIMGSPFIDIVDASEHEPFLAAINNVGNKEIDLRLITRKGRTLPVMVSISELDSNVGSVCLVVADLSKQKASEEFLRDEGERLRMLTEQLPAALWTTDSDLRYLSYSGSAIRTLNVDTNSIIGRRVGTSPVSQMMNQEERKHLLAIHRGALKGKAGEFLGSIGQQTWRINVEPLRNSREEITGVIAVGLDVTESRKKDETISRSVNRLRYLSRQLIQSQEKERKYFASELHDSVGQCLAALKIKAQVVANRIETGKALTADTSVESMIPIIQQSIDDVKRLQTDLRPVALDEMGIVAAIDWLIKKHREVYPNVKVTKYLRLTESRLSDETDIVIFRIVQEGLNNVAKHSGADKLAVSLKERGSQIVLEIKDNGGGFNIDEAHDQVGFEGGLGLTSMSERAELSGGSFSIVSSPDSGTTITAIWKAAGLGGQVLPFNLSTLD